MDAMDYQPRHASPADDAGLPHLIRGADTRDTDEGVALAEHALADVYASLRSLNAVDPYDLDVAFAQARARINAFRSASQASAQLSSQARKRPAARRGRESRDPSRYHRPVQARRQQPGVRPAIPDVPGMELCPDPRDTRTAAEFLDCLRNYRIWAGKPSFRAMERRCDRRYAASTLCTALRAGTMPSLEMVLTIVRVCGGADEHQQEFASAWRRLTIGTSAPAT